MDRNEALEKFREMQERRNARSSEIQRRIKQAREEQITNLFDRTVRREVRRMEKVMGLDDILN